MKKLVVDTSTSALSVALFEGEQCVQHELLIGHKQHGETLVSVVSQLLAQQQWQASDITHLTVGIGPGSYTGLRVGVTMMKVWATTKKIPLTSVSSLGLLAANVAGDGLIVPVMDARRMTAYTGAYRWQDGVLQAVLDDCHSEWESWLSQLSQIIRTGERVTFVGEGIEDFVAASRTYWQSSVSVDHQEGYPNAVYVEHVVQEPVTQPLQLAPNYCHMTLAEQEWQDKQQSTVDYATLVEHY